MPPVKPQRPARSRKARGEGMAAFDGLGVSPGIAIGPAFVHGVEAPAIAECAIAPDQV